MNKSSIFIRTRFTMWKKILIICITTIFSQLMVSCLCGGECPSLQTYNVNYTEVILSPWDTSGFYEELVDNAEDTVYRHSFAIGVHVQSEIDLISSTGSSFSAFGFQQAMACSPCENDEYLFPDPISNITLSVMDIETNETKDISSYVGILNYQTNEIEQLADHLSSQYIGSDSYNLQLVQSDVLPDACIFIVEVFTSSGKSFTAKTNRVNFYP